MRVDIMIHDQQAVHHEDFSNKAKMGVGAYERGMIGRHMFLLRACCLLQLGGNSGGAPCGCAGRGHGLL